MSKGVLVSWTLGHWHFQGTSWQGQRTVHDAFLGSTGNVPEDGGEESKGFEELGEAPF